MAGSLDLLRIHQNELQFFQHSADQQRDTERQAVHPLHGLLEHDHILPPGRQPEHGRHRDLHGGHGPEKMIVFLLF